MTNRTTHPAGLALAAAFVVAGLAATPVSAGSNVIRFRLSTTGIDPDARAGIEYDATPGTERFRLKALDLPAGSYVVLMNGSPAGTIDVSGPAGATHGLLKLSTADGTLGFSPFGAEFAISGGSSLFVSGRFPAGLDAQQSQLVTLDLQASGASLNASGRAELREKEGRKTFKVAVGKLAKGSYEFQLEGVLMGFVDVDGQGSGSIKFSTQPSDAGFDGDDYLPLTFDPSGKTIAIVSAGQVMLQGTFPGLSGGCGPGGCTLDPTDNGPAVVR